MTISLDLAAAIELQKRLSRGAFFTGAMLYLEGVAGLVLLTETRLSLPFVVPIALVIGAQAVLVREPVSLLVRGRLVASYVAFLVLAGVYVALAALGSRGGDRLAAAVFSALVVAATAWPVIATIRAAQECRGVLHSVANPAVLLACLSFDMRSAMSRRLRSFGGDHKRWAAPFVVGIAVAGACFIVLALVLRAMRVKVGGPIGQVAAFAGAWAFYRTLRHTKPRAAELRVKDERPPVLILREFGDDELGTAMFSPGRSFEQSFARELDRIGPTISVGRPGERLAPLGAARDYLDSPDWKSAVGTMIDDAAVVAFLLGDSGNLLWEFQRTVETRGRGRALVIVPPLQDPNEVQRRWANFVEATASAIGPGLPADLPNRLLAFAFAGDDIVLFVGGGKPGRLRSWFSKGPIDCRLALRLFGCLLPEHPASARDVEAFVHANLPVVNVRDARRP